MRIQTPDLDRTNIGGDLYPLSALVLDITLGIVFCMCKLCTFVSRYTVQLLNIVTEFKRFCVMMLCDACIPQQHNSVCLQIAATLCITNLIDKNEDGKHV